MNDDPIADYGQANPVPDAAKPTPQDPAALALLKEITMSTTHHLDDTTAATRDEHTHPAGVSHIGSRRRPRRILQGAAAAAVAVVVGAGAAMVWPGETETAAAALLNAAEQTAATQSGAIDSTVVFEAPDFDRMVMTTQQVFDQSDISVSLVTEGAGGIAFEFVSVDGILYQKDNDGAWTTEPGSAIPPEVADTPDVVAFVSTATSVTDCDVAGDAVDTYCVTVDDIEAINTLLPSQSFEPTDGVAEADVKIDVDSESGLISSLSVEAEAVTPTGSDGTITFDVQYRGLGERQQIEAPDLD